MTPWSRRSWAELGQKVKKGDPLVDLFSTDLAAAKNDYQQTVAYVQWQHDLEAAQDALKSSSPRKPSRSSFWSIIKNDESKSRLAYTTAKEKLLVFGVQEADIVSPSWKITRSDESLPRRNCTRSATRPR